MDPDAPCHTRQGWFGKSSCVSAHRDSGVRGGCRVLTEDDVEGQRRFLCAPRVHGGVGSIHRGGCRWVRKGKGISQPRSTAAPGLSQPSSNFPHSDLLLLATEHGSWTRLLLLQSLISSPWLRGAVTANHCAKRRCSASGRMQKEKCRILKSSKK